MKILVLNGSPKKKSDTFRLTDAFLKGLNRGGEHEVHIVNVIEKKIAPCRGCFGNPEMICVPETPMLNVPAAAIVADPLLARFEKAGTEYAANLSLSAETVAALEKPMISAEEYIRNVNGGS